MTRINAGIPPKTLSNAHLIAEHREIKRIPNCIVSGKYKLDGKLPHEFTLGAGHIKFFFNKIKYLHRRYKQIHEECVHRGFKVTDFSEAFTRCAEKHPELYNDWEPTLKAINLISNRIKERS